MEFADGEGLVDCAYDLLVQLIAEVGLVFQPGRVVGGGSEEVGDAIFGEDGVFVTEEGRDGVLGSRLNPR